MKLPVNWKLVAKDSFFRTYFMQDRYFEETKSLIIFLSSLWTRCSIKGTVMQIEKALINDCLQVSKVSRKCGIPTIYNFAVICPQFLLSFFIINKSLQLNNLKIRAAMNAKTSDFVICIEAIIYLLLYNLHDCTFKNIYMRTFALK